MSGGHWNYKDEELKDEMFNYSEKPTNVLNDIELSELVWDILNLLHDYDWFVSGDTGEEDWLASKVAFKKKWLSGSRNDRLEKLIEKRLQEVSDELRGML